MRHLSAILCGCFLAGFVGADDKRTDPPKVTAEQAKRAEELKKAIADKKKELASLEKELDNLSRKNRDLKAIDYRAGEAACVQNGLSFEFIGAGIGPVDRLNLVDKNLQISMAIRVKNVSEKDNIPNRFVSERFRKLKLSDDKGRSYFYPAHPETAIKDSKNELLIVPGHQQTYRFSFPGTPTEGAKELYLMLPQVADQPPIRVIIPVEKIKLPKK